MIPEKEVGEMRLRLALDGVAAVAAGAVATGLFLFPFAGTFSCSNAWLYIILLFVFSPSLPEKRLRDKERQAGQGKVMKACGVLFASGYALAGLDFRHSWSNVPVRAVCAASAVLLIGWILYSEVLRENAWLSRAVEIQEGQGIVDSGLYGVVRSPMHLAMSLIS